MTQFRPATADHLWGIVLAGGEGERMRSFTSRWLGRDRPKQYCTFCGTRSMLRHTLDRMVSVVRPDRVVTVIGSGHRGYLEESCGLEIPGRIVVEQPIARGTAAGIFVAATYVFSRDPSATVLIFPSDHFVYPEERFLANVQRAVETARRLDDRLILLGAIPHGPEPEYGWIEPAETVFQACGHAAKKVTCFHEKPGPREARRFYQLGWLWNTMVMVVNIQTLWSLGSRFFPAMMRQFEAFRTVLRFTQNGAAPGKEERVILSQVYGNLENVDFSSGLLQSAAEWIAVLPMQDVDWNDWGRPERVVESLASIGKRPSFPALGKGSAVWPSGGVRGPGADRHRGEKTG